MHCSWKLAATLMMLVPGSAWAQLALERGIPTAAVLSRYGLEVAWTGQAVLNPQRDKLEHIALDEELVYLQGTNGVITAFESESGHQIWAVRLGAFDGPTFPAVSNEDLVTVVAGTYMYGLQKRTGEILWKLRLSGAPSTGPTVDDTQVYVGTLDGSVYAYNLKKIRELYLEQRLGEWSYQSVTWRFQAAREISSPPLVTDESLNFGSLDGSMYSITKDRRVLRYQFETDAPIVAGMALLGETQFFASEDLTFYAINPANGQVYWEFVTGLPIRKAPIALGSTVYINPDRGGFYALDVADGRQRWYKPRQQDFVGLVNNLVVTRDFDHNLVLVDNSTGNVAGRIPAAYYEMHAINDRSDRVILATTRGQAMVIRAANRSFPIYHRYPERRPILPEFAPEEPEQPATAEDKPAEEPGQEANQ